MKKTLLLSTAALMLTASTAFAYTNEYAGYTINNKKPECVLESSKTYGYMNMADKKVHTISFFTAEDMEQVLGAKFTTATFDEAYAKLAVLDKNKLDKSILDLPLLDLDRYSKIDKNQALMTSGWSELKKELKPEIRLDKIGGKKAITLSLLCQQKGELVHTDISLLSSNNKLYMLVSGGTEKLEAKAAENEKTAATDKLSDKLDSLKEVGKLQAVDRASLDPALLAKSWKQHAGFVKAFKALPTTGASKPVLAYTDIVSGKKVTLPKDWAYMQYNHIDKKNPGSVSVALPTKTFDDIGAKVMNKDFATLVTGVTDQQAAAKKVGTELLGCVEQIFISGSLKIDKDKDLTDMLANPLVTKLQADMFFKEGLKRLKGFGNEYIKLNDYQYSSKFDVNKGAVNIVLDVTALEKYDFLKHVKLSGTPERASGVIYLLKKGITHNNTLKATYEKWEF